MTRRLLVVLGIVLLITAGCADVAPTNDDRSEDGTTGDGPQASEDATPTDEVDTDGELEIHYIDVGQGDATLLIEPSGETMLIDSGDWRDDGADVIGYLEQLDIERIDHLVATHGHADHIGGHEAVIDHYETERDGIGAAYDSGVPATSQTYDRYLDAIEDHDVELFLVEAGDSVTFGEATVTIVNPPAGDSGSDLDDNSVALSVEFGSVSTLHTGDAGATGERRMIETYGDDLDATVYQAGHHGSSTSSTDPFLDHVSPETAIISSAADSQYGHPHDEVLTAFAERDIETYWTGVHGTIVFSTDGEEYTIEPKRAFSTDAADLLDAKPDNNSNRALRPPTTLNTAMVDATADDSGHFWGQAPLGRTTQQYS